MKKLSRIISAILIASMLSTGVYATEMPVGNQEVDLYQPENINEIDIDQNGNEAGDTVENDNVIPQENDDASMQKSIMDYITDLKMSTAELKDGKVTMSFTWALMDPVNVPESYNVYLSETKLSSDTDSLSNAVTKHLDADALSVGFEGLSKGHMYYIALEPRTDSSDTDGQIKFCSGIYIDTPQIEKVTSTATTATVTFSKVTGATRYELINETLNKKTDISADKTAITVNKLENNKKYTFRIKAVYEKDGVVVQDPVSDAKSVTTKISVPKKPSLQRIEPDNKAAILKWNKVSGATSYEVYRYYNKKWSRIKTLNGITYKNKNLKVNKKYKYRVRAVRTVRGKSAYSEWSVTRSITAKAYLTGNIRMGYSEGVLKRNSKIYKEGSSTKLASSSMISAGTKVTITKIKKVGGHKMARVKISGRNECWIMYGNISLYAPYRTLDYTTQNKERFMNRNGYSSKTKYLLFVCHYTQRTYVFKGKKGNWKQIHNYRIASGKAYTRTPRGKFRVYAKRLHSPTSSAMYVTYFSKGGNSFHSRPAGLATIGRPASNGCIRMYTPDARYIYNSIPMNTTVISY